MLLETSQIRRSYKETRIGRKLVKSNLTLMEVARKSGVSAADVSNYLHGKRGRIGGGRRKKIRSYLVSIGILKPIVKRPPKCRKCGTEYPTRKQCK